MNFDISQFHFIRPWLLLAMPALILVWFMAKELLKNNHWENVISKEMLAALQIDQNKASSRWRWLLLIAWVVAVISIAGPTWEKTPLPTLQNQKALVIALDLSPSMLAQDLSPDRLTRAKFKLIDILRKQGDGQVALIAYAGDAHTVSPLTDDPRTIESLLTALHPNIMPSQGSNTEQAVALAQQLLADAQASNGDILIITDGITATAQRTIKQQLKPALGAAGARNKLSILGVGGSQPAPIPQEGGGFLRGGNGEIVLAGVNNAELNDLATSHNGEFASLSNDSSDIQRLLNDGFEAGENSQQEESQSVFYDSWEDMGHWLVLLLLPLAAFCFRKGLIYLLPIMFMLPIDSEAQSPSEISEDKSSWHKLSLNKLSWDNLWRTPDQQGQDLAEQKEYARAAEKFKRQDLAGAANYKANNFEQAIEQFSNSDGLDNLYNKGNAQAYNGDLEGALETYEKVLEQQADFADAAHNKKIVEELLEQQQEQQEGQDGEQNEEENQEQQDSDQQSEDSSENSDSEESEEQSQDQQQSDSEQDPSESEEEQSDAEQQEESEEQQEDEEEQESEQQEKPAEEQEAEQAEAQAAEETEEPLKDTSEQWLRTIKDDPGRLLRNKFRYQAQQRNNDRRRSNQSDNNNTENRY